jgi:hypothetical protein
MWMVILLTPGSAADPGARLRFFSLRIVGLLSTKMNRVIDCAGTDIVERKNAGTCLLMWSVL